MCCPPFGIAAATALPTISVIAQPGASGASAAWAAAPRHATGAQFVSPRTRVPTTRSGTDNATVTAVSHTGNPSATSAAHKTTAAPPALTAAHRNDVPEGSPPRAHCASAGRRASIVVSPPPSISPIAGHIRSATSCAASPGKGKGSAKSATPSVSDAPTRTGRSNPDPSARGLSAVTRASVNAIDPAIVARNGTGLGRASPSSAKIVSPAASPAANESFSSSR